MDPLVVDIAPPLRWLLVHAIILPRRPQASAALYKKIWTDRGSPLLFHLEDLVTAVRKILGGDWIVEGGMRYRRPSIAEAFSRLRAAGVDDVTAFPLYPQYSLSATRSSELEVQRQAGAGMHLRFVPPFYSEPGFLDSFASVARRELSGFAPDHILFSFHGLPERQVKKTDSTGTHCFSGPDCCARVGEANRNCYRAQCFHTARELAARLKLNSEQYTVCFQSRLGRTPWIRPFTDVLYRELPARGVRRIAVLSPSFVADCLETLEEIAIRGADDFKKAGGEELRLISSLNSDPEWARAVAALATRSSTRA
jgi:ferrochelatase